MNLNRLEAGLKRAIHMQRNCLNKESSERLTELANTYTWKDANDWHNIWQEHKYFQPKNEIAGQERFKMILPPPNVTGVLHLGHALTCTIQDVLARWHRMNGKSVLWVPGLDHAGIATQVVVEKYLHKTEGIGRYDLGKDHFVSYMTEWKDKKGDEIRNQLRSLDTSLDWSREFFTMSNEHNEAVKEAFVILNERRLLYRNKALINWSTSLCSAISDMEIEHVQVTGKTEFIVPGYEKKVTFGLIAEVAYKLRDSEEELSIATTRPETMHGDVAIAVNPEDSRYSSYIGRQVWHPLRENFIPIIADSSVQKDFGTGAVKITPAHDHNDLEVAKRHKLETIDVIGNDGKLTTNAKSFGGLPRFVAREKILNELARQGALKSLDNHDMQIPICSRSGDIVEYLMREQWFVRTKEMAERAVEAVKNGSLKIDPPEWSKLWCDWLGNNRDWCVSRQIWWGHRIPAYCYEKDTTRDNGNEWIVARSEEEARLRLGENVKFEKNNLTIQQDPDVLDTWFSSALLPLSAMGWPDQKFVKYYPLSLMVTGHDIIFLWVARMVMLGLELTNTLPFKEVLLHGVLCDSDGKKMSKSRGNVIGPEHVINGITLKELHAHTEENYKAGILNKEEFKRSLAVTTKMFPEGITDCGTDALRLTLCSHNVKTSRVSFNVIECRTNKHFCNKIWQATKYVLRATDDNENPVEKQERLSTVDRWILSRLSLMVMKVNDAFEEKIFYKAVLAIKQFFYYEFCDFFLEATKPAFKTNQREIIESHRYILARCLEVSLRILAPITPYLSDHLYTHCAKKLPNIFPSLPSVVEAPYPKFTHFQESRDPILEEKFDRVLRVIAATRNLLAQINDKSESRVHIVTDDKDEDSQGYSDFLMENINIISAVTRVQNIEIFSARNYVRRENSVVSGIAGSEFRVFLLLDENVVDLVKGRIEKKRLQSEKKLENLFRIMSLPKFRAKPEAERLREREKVNKLEEELKHYPKFS